MDAVTRWALTAFAVMALAQAPFAGPVAAQTAQTREVPMFEPDPSWPKLPNKYVWGQVSSVSIPAACSALSSLAMLLLPVTSLPMIMPTRAEWI